MSKYTTDMLPLPPDHKKLSPQKPRLAPPESQSDWNLNETQARVIDRDECYYFTDVTFLVGGTLFKVPRYPFTHTSEVFRDMFLCPVPDGMPPDGSSDEKPLVLEGIEKTDFRQLLRVMFPRSPPDIEVMSRLEWLSVLKLTMLWDMENMKKLAIKEILCLPASREEWVEMLRISTSQGVSEIRENAIQHLDSDSLPSVERILLGKECCIYEWLLKGYRELVERDETISKQDEEQLGREATMSLFRVRDQYCRRRFQNRYGYINFNLDGDIRSAFEKELLDAGYPQLVGCQSTCRVLAGYSYSDSDSDSE